MKTGPAVFDFLQAAVLDGLWYWDLTQPTQQWADDTFWRTLGYAPGEQPPGAQASLAALHPSARAAAEQQLAAASLETDPQFIYNQTLRYAHRNGSAVWLRCQGLLLRDAAGTPTRLLGALLNVTQEKQEQLQAQEIATHYGTILSNQSVYIIKTDTEGNYTYVNDFLRALRLRQQGYWHVVAAQHCGGGPAQVHCGGAALLQRAGRVAPGYSAQALPERHREVKPLGISGHFERGGRADRDSVRGLRCYPAGGKRAEAATPARRDEPAEPAAPEFFLHHLPQHSLALGQPGVPGAIAD
ncbi:MAG: PAS domain-containing protein [Hymenobacter sp.]